MSDFNLDKAIKNWRKKLEKYPDLEPGYIEELEAHLRDKIDYLLAEDFNLEEAFLKASEDVTGGLPEVIEEFRSSRTNGKKSTGMEVAKLGTQFITKLPESNLP